MAVVEQRYAQALADLVAKGVIEAETLRRELGALAQVVDASAPLRVVLGSPTVSWGKKLVLLDAVSQRLQLSRLTRNFFVVAAERGRIPHLAGMARAFERLLLEQRNIVPVEVSSARPLSEQERAAIEGELSQRLGRQLEMQFHIDADLLGGFVARVGDQIYDGSLSGRLQRLRQALLTA